MNPHSKPPWIRRKLVPSDLKNMRSLLSDLKLNTVCESAQCPNRGECFCRGTATFMILGNICTRNCRFCAVDTGEPQPVDPEEPKRVAEAAKRLKLKHVVVTSVTRDDLPDGGAEQFALTIKEIRKALSSATIEVLIPDFQGDENALSKVLDAKPDVLNHNLETIPRLYKEVRPQADYKRSLNVLELSKRAGLKTKSGLMVGLGENKEEVIQTLKDLRGIDCDFLTIGQYLLPSKKHYPLQEYVTPEAFEEYKQKALELGFKHVESAPLVRSSYHAEEAL